MIYEDVKLGEAYLSEVGRNGSRRVERVVILNSDGDKGWWAYVPSNRHRCHILSALDLSPLYPESQACS